MTGYYDVVLGLIPASLVGVTGVLTVAGLTLTLAVSVASLVAIGVIGHAMFVRGPGSQSRVREESPDAADSPIHAAD